MGGRAFEVDGWAEGPDFFFLGAMVDGVVQDDDGDEDVVLRTLSGLHKRAPYLVRRGTSRCIKSRSAHGNIAESTHVIYPGSGRREV